jgi:hypothetical protein
VAAVQVAERGEPSIRPISPIRLPGPSTVTTMPSLVGEAWLSTVTSPSMTSSM